MRCRTASLPPSQARLTQSGLHHPQPTLFGVSTASTLVQGTSGVVPDSAD